MHRGVATFTLDHGKCPKWLFERMVKLGREMSEVLIQEFGPNEFIKRISDPAWFQSLGTVLAFDWNASGLTTILTAALKEAIRGREREFGVFICGGKGKTSLKTPDEIDTWGKNLQLSEERINKYIYNSRMSAKVDSSLIQDGYELYHHTFFFSREGAWTVVQQGMNKEKRTARRYHWHSANIKDLIVEPHSGIMSDLIKAGPTLNMTSKSSDSNRSLSVEMVQASPKVFLKDIQILRKHSSKLSKALSLKAADDQLSFLELAPAEFHSHEVLLENFSANKYLERILYKLNINKPKNYEELLATKGVGGKTIRALSLVSEVIYGAKASYEDPARYSFAHGGKDGTPYFVDRKTYDQTIKILKKAVDKTKMSFSEKRKAHGKLDLKCS